MLETVSYCSAGVVSFLPWRLSDMLFRSSFILRNGASILSSRCFSSAWSWILSRKYIVSVIELSSIVNTNQSFQREPNIGQHHLLLCRHPSNRCQAVSPQGLYSWKSALFTSVSQHPWPSKLRTNLQFLARRIASPWTNRSGYPHTTWPKLFQALSLLLIYFGDKGLQ